MGVELGLGVGSVQLIYIISLLYYLCFSFLFDFVWFCRSRGEGELLRSVRGSFSLWQTKWGDRKKHGRCFVFC